MKILTVLERLSVTVAEMDSVWMMALNFPATCNCNAGFTGRICEININECSSNPCGEGGQCMDGVNRFQCMCYPGYIGECRQTNIDNCVGVTCTGNGQCVDGVNIFTCNCAPGYSGPLCSKGD